jgi:hypothetical protein
VNKSAPVKTTMIKPTGKTMAEMVLKRPGALVRNQGEAFVERARAHPKEIRGPPIKEFTNILSMRMRAFFAPILEMSSVVWAGVKASMMMASLGSASVFAIGSKW